MSENATENTLNVNYLKTGDFREVSADGILGGPTPHGKLWVCFYNERMPVPQVVRHKLIQLNETGDFQIDAGSPGVPIEGRTGVVRSMEVGVYISYETAREIHEWLGKQLQQVEVHE